MKAVSDIFTPIGGEITEVNSSLDCDPALVNREPFAGGWLFKIKVSDAGQKSNLLSSTAYDDLTKE